MESKARLTGYATILAILIFAVWLGRVFIHEAFHPSRIVQVRFDDLGTLRTQDPVVQRGAQVGSVKSVRLEDGQAIAEIELYRSGFLASDSHFMNFNYSLMGARKIVLVPGISPAPMDEEQIQEGVFISGVGESIQRIGELLKLLAAIRAETNRLFVGPEAPLSPEQLNQMTKNLEALNAFTRRIDESGKSLKVGFTAWNKMGTSLRTGLRSRRTDSAEKKLTNVLNFTLKAEESADATLNQLEKLLASIQDSTGVASSLLSNRQTYEDLEKSLQLLQTTLGTLQNNGLRDAVKWRNVHFSQPKPE